MPKPAVYVGTFIYTPHLGALKVLEHKAIGVDKDGVIRFIVDCHGSTEDDEIAIVEKIFEQKDWQLTEFCGWALVRGRSEKGVQRYWFPGFVARKVYSRAVSRTLSHGTTTAAYFATIHVESTNILAEICLQKGQRAFIGRCSMDSDINPSYYRDEGVEASIADTKATVSYINSIDPNHNLITPIITPRFAASCTPNLLSSLAHLAKEAHLPIQTHISENTSEIALVQQLFPDQHSYSHVYDYYGLLTSGTVLAHGIYLSASERSLIKERGAKISHCPVSNTSLSSGLCPVRELLDHGIEVGLGTDVSGGYSSSILVAAREAGMVSRVLAALYPEDAAENDRDVITKDERVSEGDRRKLTPEECLYLATRGGAKCLGLEKKVGAFEVGMEWDAQLVEIEDVGIDGADVELKGKGEDRGLAELWGNALWNDRIAKWVFCGDDRNTTKVYVKGRLVHERL
ncbi:MAG: hypothetical protein Q9217_001184 [Psora testacea]